MTKWDTLMWDPPIVQMRPNLSFIQVKRFLKRWILTAAHCLRSDLSTPDDIIDAKSVTVYFGEHSNNLFHTQYYRTERD